jgi:hypothetical protein
VDGLRVQQSSDLMQGRGVGVVAATGDEDLARGRPVEAEDHPHGRRLAGPVRAQEPGDEPGPDGEGEVPDGGRVAVTLGELPCFDHGGPHRVSCDGTAAGWRRPTRTLVPPGATKLSRNFSSRLPGVAQQSDAMSGWPAAAQPSLPSGYWETFRYPSPVRILITMSACWHVGEAP